MEGLDCGESKLSAPMAALSLTALRRLQREAGGSQNLSTAATSGSASASLVPARVDSASMKITGDRVTQTRTPATAFFRFSGQNGRSPRQPLSWNGKDRKSNGAGGSGGGVGRIGAGIGIGGGAVRPSRSVLGL